MQSLPLVQCQQNQRSVAIDQCLGMHLTRRCVHVIAVVTWRLAFCWTAEALLPVSINKRSSQMYFISVIHTLTVNVSQVTGKVEWNGQPSPNNQSITIKRQTIILPAVLVKLAPCLTPSVIPPRHQKNNNTAELTLYMFSVLAKGKSHVSFGSCRPYDQIAALNLILSIGR